MTHIFKSFGDLRAAEVSAVVGKLRPARPQGEYQSRVLRAQEKREEWLIHQSAPDLLDDRNVPHSPKTSARIDFQRLFKHV